MTEINYTKQDKDEILGYWVEQMVRDKKVSCPIPLEVKERYTRNAACLGTGTFCKPFFPETNDCPCLQYSDKVEWVKDVFWEGMI